MSGALHAWYRQPVMWLAIALPLAAVAAALALVFGAHGGFDLSPDPVRRIAQVQTADESADRRALQLGLRGEVEWGDAEVVVQVRGDTATAVGDALALLAVHATDSAQDRRLPLQPCGSDRYCARSALGNARFDLALVDAGGSWRIVGVRELGQQRIALGPAWSALR